ncbi:MAG: GGDEF domain-containing protein [Candidatus Omnitrophica bacterium]|nr:GGDEF domain-containing protein [Candidatus Omnitrophota bacterium]
MRELILLILLNVLLYLKLRKILDKRLDRVRGRYQQAKSEYDRLFLENRRAGEDNARLSKSVEETIAIYNITKDICKSLDENKVFDNFRNEMNSYIQVSDCKLLKKDADLSSYQDHTILPLSIDKTHFGYLVTSRIKEEEKDKFHILSQQFLLGIKRALLYQKVQELTVRDGLTGVFSRRYLLERLNEELERSKKFKYNFSFLMVDVDHFKDFNDRYGHLVGDAILKEIAGVIKEGIRQIDLVGRYGGEEFSIILAETDKDEAGFIAERIRQAVENRVIKVYDENLKVTISIGISVFPGNADNVLTLIDTADCALYRAKQTGRNLTCIYGTE